MRKLILVILSLLMIISLYACGGTEEKTETDNKPSEVGSVTKNVAETTTSPATTETSVESSSVPQNFLVHIETQWVKYVMGSEDVARHEIKSVTFLDTLKDKPDDAWDASQNKDGSVMAWVDSDFNLFVAGDGGVTATSCAYLFSDYYSVEYINFNNCFYTDMCNDMESMFNGCNAITELDLSCFNTSKVYWMNSMFKSCFALKKCDVSSFDTSKVNDMRQMFANCFDLCELDLSNFDFSSAKKTNSMFNGCSKLTDIGCTIELPADCEDENMYENSDLE